MTSKRWMTALWIVSWTAACEAPPADALFRDIARRPPDATPATIQALKQDRPFATWVLYQDRMCDRYGCR